MAGVLGEALLWAAPGRRRLIRSNLAHAFPERSAAWRNRTARLASRRLIETGLLSLATPHLSEARIRRIARLGPSVDAWARARAARGKPVVFATLHLALWESQTWLPLLSPAALPEFAIIFRPLDSGAADRYVKRTRERFGMRLLSRKEGFAQAARILRHGGCVGILFDQNAGDQGGLSLLFGRVCSSTELPGMLAERFGADLRTFYPRRVGFWRVVFESDPIEHDGTAAGMTLALNRWLERALSEDPALCASWLWAHNRWRNQDVPARRLRLEAKRNLLEPDLAARGLAELPRRTRLWIRMPNWLGDVVMLLPLLRAVRLSRPDAEVTLFARAAFAPLLVGAGIADAVEPLPRRGAGYWLAFLRRRGRYADVWIAFTNSFRGDLEGWLAGVPQRFGIRRPGHPRPLLTHHYRPPAGWDPNQTHQTALWEAFLRAFGLATPVSHVPIRWEGPGDTMEPLREAPLRVSDAAPLSRAPVGREEKSAARPAATAAAPKTEMGSAGAEPRRPGDAIPDNASAIQDQASSTGAGRAAQMSLAATTGAEAQAPSTEARRGEALTIGLIAGSENEPAKRWPVNHWRRLIAELPTERIVLLGTEGDRPITAAVAAGFPPDRVADLAGRTDLAEFIRRLRACSVVVTNDTGGMHLANALGVPTIGLFGPTNPLRTGPIYAAPRILLQPPHCPSTGGRPLADLPVETVLRAVTALLPSKPSGAQSAARP